MKKALIHRFFKELDQELGRPAEVILTGAAAGSLLGVVRPSMDIDFQIKVRWGRKRPELSEVREAIQRAAEKTGVAVNYSEDIGHWSMINFLNYSQTALSYGRIGQLRIQIMGPKHWTIGKMGRFLELDIRDILRVIQRRKLKSDRLISLWGRALRSSPLSLELGTFRRNVIYFIERYGKKAWGRTFARDRAIRLFKKSAGIPIMKGQGALND